MIRGPYGEGYYAGLVADQDNPHSSFWSPINHVMWELGNVVGLEQHRQFVEHVYVTQPHD